MAEHENSIGKSDDWYTPPEIFDALGLTFDLDPCSPGAGHWVPAQKVYTKDDNGLLRHWHGLVFALWRPARTRSMAGQVLEPRRGRGNRPVLYVVGLVARAHAAR